MGLSFRKRIRIFKGLTLNLGTTGASWTIGKRGLSVNLRNGKVTGNIGIPGTGLSYRGRLGGGQTTAKPTEFAQSRRDPPPIGLAALKRPSTLIILTAVINFVAAGVGVAHVNSVPIVDPATLTSTLVRGDNAADGQHRSGSTLLTTSRLDNAASWLLAAALSVIMFIGGLKMRHAMDYQWAVAACAVAMLPCTSLFFFTIPIGIWGLVRVCRPDVRAVFR